MDYCGANKKDTADPSKALRPTHCFKELTGINSFTPRNSTNGTCELARCQDHLYFTAKESEAQRSTVVDSRLQWDGLTCPYLKSRIQQALWKPSVLIHEWETQNLT